MTIEKIINPHNTMILAVHNQNYQSARNVSLRRAHLELAKEPDGEELHREGNNEEDGNPHAVADFCGRHPVVDQGRSA